MKTGLIKCVVAFSPVLLGCLILAGTTSAQTKPQKPDEGADVIKVSTDLVQTDVMVFDKDGHFVDDLKGEQFALKIDNKSTPISFFDRVTSGKASLDRKPGSSSDSTAPASSVTPNAISTIVRGRTVIFFVDDLHLAPGSIVRTRQALLDFIDRGMADNDQVAITSSSGQIGFLQQLTTDRYALRSAVARLNFRGQASKTDMFRPPMSEYIAMKIRDGDRATMELYMSEMMKQECYKTVALGPYNCFMSPQAMRSLIIERANMITMQAGPDTRNTLSLLQGLMRTAAQLPGRKLVFVISDGFFLNDREMNSHDKVRKITEAAGRAGVVIYTFDARGIIGENFDVTNDRPMDGGGFTTGLTHENIAASQDGMNALAGDTGGRAFRNTNAPMSELVDKVLDETANYYLVAWRPDNEEQKRGKFNHIEASIIGRPDLTVRVRSAYFKSAPLPILTTKKKADKDSTKAREDDMRLVIDAPVAQTQIPTKLELRVGQMPGVGTQVAATININREALSFDLKDGKQAADLDIGGIFYDDKGKPVDSFVGRLRVFPIPEDAPPEKRKGVIYGFRAWLPPGLYQVRVGIRDVSSGRLGSALEWIEIPKLGSK